MSQADELHKIGVMTTEAKKLIDFINSNNIIDSNFTGGCFISVQSGIIKAAEVTTKTRF